MCLLKEIFTVRRVPATPFSLTSIIQGTNGFFLVAGLAVSPAASLVDFSSTREVGGSFSGGTSAEEPVIFPLGGDLDEHVTSREDFWTELLFSSEATVTFPLGGDMDEHVTSMADFWTELFSSEENVTCPLGGDCLPSYDT